MSGIDFGEINAAALAVLAALLPRWLPGGQRRSHEWVARNPTRVYRQPGSFSVNMRTGRWADFRDGRPGRRRRVAGGLPVRPDAGRGPPAHRRDVGGTGMNARTPSSGSMKVS